MRYFERQVEANAWEVKKWWATSRMMISIGLREARQIDGPASATGYTEKRTEK